jgi:SAM-dependent methyltransferase
MGMNPKSTDYFFDILRAAELRDFSKLSICILGNQIMRPPSWRFPEYHYRTFRRLLVGHKFGRAESIDINGKDHSLIMDLSKPVDQELIGKFDVIHNGGTTEHILHNQWQVFKNLNDLLKPCGIMIHAFLVPGNPRTIGHGYWVYDEEFFYWLAKTCSYKIVDIQSGMTYYGRYSHRRTYFVTLQKRPESVFVKMNKWHDPPYDDRGVIRFLEAAGFEYDLYVKNCLERK